MRKIISFLIVFVLLIIPAIIFAEYIFNPNIWRGLDYYEEANENINANTITVSTGAFDNVTVDTATINCQEFVGGTTTTEWDLTDNIIGFWKMNDNAANTDVADVSSNTYTGTAQQNTSAISTDTAKIDRALIFNGSSDNIDLSSYDDIIPGGTTIWTIGAWIKGDDWAGADNGERTIFYEETTSNTYTKMTFRVRDTSYLHAQYGQTATSAVNLGTSASALSTDTWYLVGVTVDTVADEAKFWINGALNQTNSFTGTAITASAANQEKHIGAMLPALANYNGEFDGIIDLVFIVTGTLTESQWLALYNSGNGTESITDSYLSNIVGSSSNVEPLYIDGTIRGTQVFEKDVEIQGDLTIGGNTMSETNLVIGGIAEFADYLYHKDDSGDDTYIVMQEDDIKLTTHFINAIHITEGTTDKIIFDMGCYPQTVTSLPTTGYDEGAFIYNTTDHKMYISTETVTGAGSWAALN